MNELSLSKKVAYLGVFSALAAVFGYVEGLVPINVFGVPGIKLGLANLISMIFIYVAGLPFALIIMVVRVTLVGFMFGNLYSVIFGLAGGFVSIFVMYVLKKTDKFGPIGISAAGGAFHNIGQYIVAMITLNEINLFKYLPILIIAGVTAGIIIGILTNETIKRINIKQNGVLKS